MDLSKGLKDEPGGEEPRALERSSRTRPPASPPPVASEQSTELLGLFIQLMPDAGIVVDESGLIVAANEQADSVFGYAPESVVGRTVESLIPERVRHRHRQHREAYASTPAVRPMGKGLVLAGRRKNGSEFPVDISLAPVAGAGSTLVVASIRDVTAQHEAVADQAQLATIVRSSVDAIISISVQGKVSSWNPAAEALFGYDRDEMIGEHVQLLVPHESSELFEELLARAEEGEHEGARDTLWRRRDGTHVDVAVSISPLRDDSGRLLGYSCLARDVSERKRQEAELRRLLAEEERLERLHAVTSEIRLFLLSEAERAKALALIAERATELLTSSVTAICMSEGDEIEIVAATDQGAVKVGARLAAPPGFAEFVESGHPRSEDHLSDTFLALPETVPDGPSLIVPIVAADTPRAVMVSVREPGSRPFATSDVVAAEGLAGQAALAFELERARSDRERMMLVVDRERIARDLHDHVIQQLFAIGMYLQGALPFIEQDTAADRVSEAIDELDDTIREIRNTIYGLLRSGSQDAPLRAQLVEVVKTYEETLGFSPALRLQGPIDTAVPRAATPHVVAVVREALSNTARHAAATGASVDIVLSDGYLVVKVTDNGVGIKAPTRSSGLSNLEERASEVGGSFEVSSPAEGGTRLEWRMPLSK